MVLKNGSIIPFIFDDEKKLVSIICNRLSRKVSFLDVQLAIYAAFPNLKGKCEFYNKKIGFNIPEKLLVPYLDQRHDLTNFVIEIVGINEDAEENPFRKTQKITDKSNRREGSEVYSTQMKKIKSDSVDCQLQNILKKVNNGEEVCKSFEISNHFNAYDRAMLIDLVMSSEFNDVLEFKTLFTIDANRLRDLAAAIVRRFPNEDPGIYFNETLKPFKYISGGKLYECFLEKKIKQIEEMERNKVYLNLDERAIEENFPELIELQNFRGDFEYFFKAWQYTFGLRTPYFRISLDPTGYLEKFITNFYDKTNGLVEYDFERLYPNKGNNLFENWNNMSDKIYTEALVMGLNDVPLIMDLYANMPELSSLMILSYFVRNYGREVPNKPFKKDSPENLVIHIENTIKNPGDFFAEYSEIYNLSKPLVFATGKIKDKLNLYVLVGFKIFKMETILKAVDFCFKCYHALQLSFNSEQSLSWKVIQNAFYDIETDCDCAVTENILKIFKNS